MPVEEVAVRRIAFPVVAVALACLLWAGPALAAKDYDAERFDVLLEVQPGGALVVTETVRFRFEGGPFTYVFRDLAYTNLDAIDRLQAGIDGALLPQGTGSGQVEIVAGRPLKVTWHLPPTSDAVHEFVLTYRVQGAIRQEAGADTLLWRAIPEERDYDIERSTITLRYPASAALLGAELLGVEAKQVSGDGQVQWAAAEIEAGESPVVAARFSAGSLVEAPPQWQVAEAARRQQTAQALPAALAAGLLTLAGGLAALAAFLLGRRRAGPAGRARPAPVLVPPDETPPGLAVMLAGAGSPALATLFDLAGRGLLRVRESGKALLGGRQFSLERLPAEAELRPHEAGLLRALFEDKGGQERDSLPLSQIAGRLSGRNKWYREPLEQEMEAAGWLDPGRKAGRQWLLAAAVVAVLLGGAVMTAGFIVAGSAAARGSGPALTLGAVAAGVGVALLLLGLVALAAGGAFSPLSVPGEQAAAAWQSFGAYLKDIVRGREFVAGDALFERYLPFAAGLGLGERWARHFQKQGYTQIPAWFQVLQADADDFGAVIALMAAANASVSSADGGAAGAAGASGGGASGAG
jgi:hypothetical protein